jgi:hypothetical protein
MQYVVVRLRNRQGPAPVRGVWVNGAPFGNTEALLTVPEGTHTFSLDPPLDFTPSSQKVVVQTTSPLHPMEVIFETP